MSATPYRVSSEVAIQTIANDPDIYMDIRPSRNANACINCRRKKKKCVPLNGPNTVCKRCRDYGWDCQYIGQESSSPSSQAQSLSPSPTQHTHTQISSGPYGRSISHSAASASHSTPLQLDEPSMFLGQGLPNVIPPRDRPLPTHFHNTNTQRHASQLWSDFSEGQIPAHITQPTPYNPLSQIAPPTFTETPTRIQNSFGDLPVPGESFVAHNSTEFAQFSIDDSCCAYCTPTSLCYVHTMQAKAMLEDHAL